MPTGGGKSLCYQLPALATGKTAIVVSPLIALMQDQAAQLAQMGIPAAVLNSMMPGSEQSGIMRQARAGEYRLLYLSPERLARPETPSAGCRHVPVAFFAIDEAHCISEWGHEFRPEYRQLSRLRDHFPGPPHRGLYRQRNPARAARHPASASAARSAQVHCQLPPPESALRGQGMRRATRSRNFCCALCKDTYAMAT